MSEWTPTPNEVAEGFSWWHEHQTDGSPGIPIKESTEAVHRMIASVERAAAAKALRDAADWVDRNFQTLPRWNEAWKNGTRTHEYEGGAIDASVDIIKALRARAERMENE